MRNPSRHTLTLELEVDADDDVAGRLFDAQGRGADFVGWLGLASAIETLSASGPTEPLPASGPTEPLPASPRAETPAVPRSLPSDRSTP